jgi:hypothetical protein
MKQMMITAWQERNKTGIHLGSDNTALIKGVIRSLQDLHSSITNYHHYHSRGQDLWLFRRQGLSTY